MFEKGKRQRGRQLLFHPPIAFVRNYIIKGGFGDGNRGYYLASNSYYVMLEIRKTLGLQRTRKKSRRVREVGGVKESMESESRWRRRVGGVGESMEAEVGGVRESMEAGRRRSQEADVFDSRGPAKTWRGGQRRCCSLWRLRGAVIARCSSRTLKANSPRARLKGTTSSDWRRVAESICTPAGNWSRIINHRKPDIVHRARSAAVALRPSRCRSDVGHLSGLSHHAAWRSSQRERVLAMEGTPGRLFRGGHQTRFATQLIGDGVDPDASPRCTRVSPASYTTEPAATSMRVLAATHAPIVGAVAALTQRKGKVPDRCGFARRARSAVRDSSFSAKVTCGLRSNGKSKSCHLEKHRGASGFRSDILSFIQSFDLFVMSSLFEGLGTSLLDAMALSKPIVASNTGAFRKRSRWRNGHPRAAPRRTRARRRRSRLC